MRDLIADSDQGHPRGCGEVLWVDEGREVAGESGAEDWGVKYEDGLLEGEPRQGVSGMGLS